MDETKEMNLDSTRADSSCEHDFAESIREREEVNQPRSKIIEKLLTHVQEEVRKQDAYIAELINEISKKNQEKEKAEKELEKETRHVKELQDRIDELSPILERSGDQLVTEKQSEVQNQRAHIKELTKELEKAKKALEKHRLEMGKQKTYMESQVQEHETILTQMEDLKKKLKEKERKLSQMTEEKKRLESEKERLIGKIAVLEEEKTKRKLSEVKKAEETELRNQLHQIRTSIEEISDHQIREVWQKFAEMEKTMKAFITREQFAALKVTKDETNVSFTMHDEKIVNAIRTVFVSKIIPGNVLHIFHHYNRNVLVQQDIEEVTNVTSNRSRRRGAAELLNLLVAYKGWFSCLLQALRDPAVKQNHVADEMWDELGMRCTRQKNDSIDEVKEKVWTATEILEHVKVFHCEDGIRSLKFINQTFLDYASFRTDIIHLLCDLSFPETCMKILKEEVQVATLHEERIWQVIDCTYDACVEYSGESETFAKMLAEAGAVKYMTEVLSQKHYLDNLYSEEEYKVMKASVVVLLNIAVLLENIRQAFKDSKSVEVLMPLTNVDDETIKVIAMMILASIAEEEDRHILTDTSGIIKIMVQWMKKAIEDKNCRKYEVFPAWYLSESLAAMAVNNVNRSKIIDAEAMEVFLSMLRHTVPREQAWCAECLRRMASNETVRRTIKGFPGLVTALTKLQMSKLKFVRNNVRAALQIIQGNNDTQTEERANSLQEVKKKVLTAVTTIQQMNVRNCADDISFHKCIYYTSLDHPSYTNAIGDYLADCRYAETCMKILHEMMGVCNIHDDKMWMAILYTYYACWNYSRVSSKFVKQLVQSDAVRLMTNNLKQEPFLNNLHKWRESFLIEASLAVLFHISVEFGDIHYFKDSRTVEALMPLVSHSSNKVIKVSAMMTSALIVEKERKDLLTDTTGIIKIMVEWIHGAVGNREDRSFKGFTLVHLTTALGKLAENDVNKLKIIEAEALREFLAMLQQPDPIEKAWAAKLVWTLALDGNLRPTIKTFPGLLRALTALRGCDNAARDHVEYALGMLQE